MAERVFSIDLERLLLRDRVLGCRVALRDTGEVGLLFTAPGTSASNGSGVPPNAIPSAVTGNEHADGLQSDIVSRVRAYGELYGLHTERLAQLLRRWKTHEQRLLAALCMAYGPECLDIPITSRVAAYCATRGLEPRIALHAVFLEHRQHLQDNPGALTEDELEQLVDRMDAARSIDGNNVMLLLRQRFGGVEPSPATYLYPSGKSNATGQHRQQEEAPAVEPSPSLGRGPDAAAQVRTRHNDDTVDARRRAASARVRQAHRRSVETQVDTGKAPPVIVAVPVGLSDASAKSMRLVSCVPQGGATWAAFLQSLFADEEISESWFFTAQAKEITVEALLGSQRLLASLSDPAAAVEQLLAVREAALQAALEVIPLDWRSESRRMHDLLQQFNAQLHFECDFECTTALQFRNKILHRLFDQHVAMQHQYRPIVDSSDGSSSTTVLCFAWLSGSADAVRLATRGVPASPAEPYLFHAPLAIARTALAAGDVSTTAEVADVPTLEPQPRLWGSSPIDHSMGETPRRQVPLRRTAPGGALLLCEVYIGNAYRTTAKTVPSSLPLRAHLDNPSVLRSCTNGGGSEWAGAKGNIYDSVIILDEVEPFLPVLCVFSPQQVKVVGAFLGVWRKTDVIDRPSTSVADIIVSSPRLKSPIAEPLERVDPPRGDGSFLPSVRHGGTWDQSIEPSPVRSDDVRRAAEIRRGLAEGWRLVRTGNLPDAKRVWESSTASVLDGDNEPPGPEELAARLEVRGVVAEVIDRDALAAVSLYMDALQLSPQQPSILFRVGNLYELAFHDLSNAAAMFGEATALGDAAAARRLRLVQKRLGLA